MLKDLAYLDLCMVIIFFLARGDLCGLQITFADSLDSDQDRHSVAADLNPNPSTLW